ncbi:LysM peptidoglycan-binding domain-containing protein [Bacillus sp. DTU_2020_1000418_1_SI_GHA_SEK_038]|uniref:LysM peptidoglycan-binding domain-containing protein n=1 Tax=Bacillus sp. DTU_2020_1000418_1_SI_GHA_SEK_038 TaxID=3077585 RepID=UPI0028E3F7CA|nr:LysM peptidoglycan-binding domain-containing protein [Bacillus sp. DTU_2020_1000418_1_SI_GHA_SEK_038]WNS76372.1 LysM peptidoglycan-binding domain-containing protein [Bacillus sp. DTU_2020_1000418_1_SI_GHA_SEK_038]
MTKSLFRIFSILFIIAAATMPQFASAQAEVVSFHLSSNTVAFQGRSVPGYVTVDLKTSEPTRGYLRVEGNGRQAKINLSSFEYKTTHKIDWVPWDDVKKEPLPAGEYQIKANLSDANLNQMVGYPLGKLTVVSEPNPKPLFDQVSINPGVFSPKYGNSSGVAQIQYNLNRPAEVQLSIQKNGDEIFLGNKMKLTPGIQTFNWNGTDKSGRIVADGEYNVVFKTIETAYNYPETIQRSEKAGIITIKDGDYDIPQWRLKELVTEATFKSSVITPDGDGINDIAEGQFTLAEPAKVSVYIANAAGAHVKNVMTEQALQPGVHTFNWDGTDMMGGKVPNGNFTIKLLVIEGANLGYISFPHSILRSEGGYEFKILQPQKNVRVISEKASMSIDPLGQGYVAQKGDIFPLLSETVENGKYDVLVKEGVSGKINVNDVEIVTESPSQQNTTDYIVQPGDTLWKIAEKHKTTIAEIIKLNQLDPNKYLTVGQTLKVPNFTPEPVPPSEQTIHTVQSGDTLWKIAQKYNVTAQSIIETNKLDPNQYLSIGQKLVIPMASPAPQPSTAYKVQSGDTLWKIAQKFGTTIDAIVAANKLDPAKHLFVGQSLDIPVKSPVIEPVIHTVQSGDTLWKIAQKYNTTVDTIIKANQLDPAKYLVIGQKLTIS